MLNRPLHVVVFLAVSAADALGLVSVPALVAAWYYCQAEAVAEAIPLAYAVSDGALASYRPQLVIRPPHFVVSLAVGGYFV